MSPSIRAHPWANHLNVRSDFTITHNLEDNDQHPAPHRFNDRNLILGPGTERVLTIRECVTLDDVIAFREETIRLREQNKNPTDISSLTLNLENLSIEKKHFRIVYRFTDVIKKDAYAILEAIHFEIFMPDRPDLRFIAIPISLLPPGTCEGDYFEIYEVARKKKMGTFQCGIPYPLNWIVTQFCRIERQGIPAIDYVYVAEKIEGSDDRKAVCNWTENFIMPRHHRFRHTENDQTMEIHRIYDASLVDTSSAWIYPVEPPKNREEYFQRVNKIRSTSHYAGTFAQEISVLPKFEQDRIDDRLGDFDEFSKNMQMAENHMIRLFKLGVRFRQLITPPQKENVFVQDLNPPRLQVYTEVFYLDAVTLHFEEGNIKLTVDNIKRESIGKRKKTYIYCAQSPELLRVLGSRSANFWTDATLHGEGGSATELCLERIDRQMLKVEEEGAVKNHFLIDAEIPKMIQSMYGKNVKKDKYFTTGCYTVKKSNGCVLKLNGQQTRAMSIYHKIENSGYCILSPPGSGKTTVAAAMAASLVKDREANRQGSVQMLLAVQNVAVENLAIALKAFDDGSLRSYRMMSRVRIDPHDTTPFDVFEHFPDYMRWMKNAKPKDLDVMKKFFELEAQWNASKTKGSGLSTKDSRALNLNYMQAMFKAKGALERYMQPEIILSTVDLALFKLLDVANQGVRGQFSDVDRIIIDEASLLTESTFYCLVRCFPKASFVLIGDDKQLPPFMYDQKVLGHEIAGRAALNVAMQRKNLPIIQLVEVYRAPQQLVQPYNNLSYDGTLVSRKNEPLRPLFKAGLVSETRPDLLLVDIPKGHQRGSPSPYNVLEIDVLVRLLDLFPKSTHDDIMIICLYKEQKKKVQRRLGPDYEIMTVDSSQGKEKSIVIVLTTRTEKVTDFFSNQNRCTVAVSRHQRALIILGNNSLLTHQLPWSKVLEDFTKIEPAQIPGPKWDPLGPLVAKKAQKEKKQAPEKQNKKSDASADGKKAKVDKNKQKQKKKKGIPESVQEHIARSKARKLAQKQASKNPPILIPNNPTLATAKDKKVHPAPKIVAVQAPKKKPQPIQKDIPGSSLAKNTQPVPAPTAVETKKKNVSRKNETAKQRNERRRISKAKNAAADLTAASTSN